MKVYISTFEDDPHQSPNPYVYTLMDSISNNHADVVFETRKKTFWSDEILSFDIVHVMWPDGLIWDGLHSIEELEFQLQKIKKTCTKVVCTCHNLHSNNISNPIAVAAYDIVYHYADVFIHLGKYSYQVLSGKYQNAKQVIIHHHVYDTVYTDIPTKEEALKKLSLPNKIYAISFGAFRNSKERDLFFRIADKMKKYNVCCIAPSFMDIPKGKINKRWIKQRLKKIYWQSKHPNTILGGEYVSDEMLPYYYALSDISIIQRIDILNSGNLPLGMYFGNVIIGPNVGNVDEILKETNNCIFDINNFGSLDDVCKASINAIKNRIGIQNREFAMTTLNTQFIAEKIYQLYEKIA